MDNPSIVGGVSDENDDPYQSSSDIEAQVDDQEYEGQEEQARIAPKKVYTTASFIHASQGDHGKATHRFFGNLFLQNPVEHLSPERLHEYLQLRHAISSLENRTHNPLSSHFDYEAEFKTFQDAETKLWRNQGIERPKEELVPASGNIIASSLAHRLHNPSFITTKMRNGVTADSSNPCTALVMANGFDDKTIMIDHVVRRDVHDPFIYYPEDILACHEQHLSTVRNHMAAPIEVVYGIPTWKRTLQYLQGRLEPFDLWGSYKGIRLFLEWDSVETSNQKSERQLKRFLIAAFHPQNFLRAWSNKYKHIQDTLLEVAYKLARVQFAPQFFSSDVWQNQIDVLPHAHFTVNKLSEHKANLALTALHSLFLTSADPKVRAKSKRLHTKLTSYLDRLKSSRGNQASPEAPFTRPPLSPTASMTTIWPRKTNFSWSHLLKVSGDIIDLPAEVNCLCIACWGATIIGPERCTIAIDPKPRWTNTNPPKYVERFLTCRNCSTKRRFIPIDEKILSISDGNMIKLYNSIRSFSEKVQLEMLQEERPSSRYHHWQKPVAKMTSNTAKTISKNKEGMPRMLQSEHVESRPDKGPVTTKCTLCYNKGPINHHPQWIVGSDIYIARRTVKCMSKTCINACRHWIPQDKGIEYMTQKTFEANVKKGAFSDKTQCAGSMLKHRQNLIPK